jgi:glycosyltransferase involved in cell wall biosynthesis
MRLLYLSNARLPSVMAHGLQIMQNCEAFAANGADVTLWCAWRAIPAAESHLNSDVWAYYGVERTFGLRRLPCLDLVGLIERESWLKRLLFYLQLGTFAVAVLVAAAFTPSDIYYSRDPLLLLLLGLIKPRQQLVYEAHRLNNPGMGAWLQRQVLQRCGLTVAVTPPLREGLEKLQANSRLQSKIIVAHDGIRRARFEGIPGQAAARQQIGWSRDLFIVGYVGRLQTLGMDKGLDTLIDALARLSDQQIALAIVGGPAEKVQAYREQWRKRGLPEAQFLYAGQVAAEAVPLHLSAFDVCAMPYPWTEFFAYATSPMKLFEYMASGRAIVASALPAYADVLRDGENALLVPPGDAVALGAALDRLRQDATLREKLAQQAYTEVMATYTWDARARHILQHLP